MNRILFLGIAFWLFLPLAVSAHTTQASNEQQIGNYLIDTGYDPPQLIVGDRLLLDLNLKDPKTLEPISYGDAWVRIELDGKTLMATGVAQASIGPTTALVEIPDNAKGPVTVDIRFEKDDNSIAEASFDLPVQSSGVVPWSFLVPGLAGVIGGALGTWFFLRRKSKIGHRVSNL